MSDDSAPAKTPSDKRFHDLFGVLNALGLQLEVLGLAHDRADAAMHARALERSREAVAALTRALEELRRSEPR